jgi:hypothetical protein
MNFFARVVSVFNRGERVRIADPQSETKVYKIKDIRKIEYCGTLYLLKSLEENHVLRLYYEEDEFLLERI